MHWPIACLSYSKGTIVKSPENVLTQHHSNFRRKIAVCVIVLTPMYVFADLSPALDRGSISIGELLTNPKIDVGISTPYGNVQTGDVSLGKQKMPRVKAEIILFDNQGISFDTYKYKRSYTAGFHEVGNIAGNSITADGNASLDVQLDYSKLAYKWWLGSENTVLGIGLGAAYYKLLFQ